MIKEFPNGAHTISDEEVFAGTWLLNAVSLVVDFIGLLVIDEDVGWAGTLKPSLQDWLVGHIRE